MYAAFGGPDDYPLGGFLDFVAAGPDVDELIRKCQDECRFWWHIVNIVTQEIVADSDGKRVEGES